MKPSTKFWGGIIILSLFFIHCSDGNSGSEKTSNTDSMIKPPADTPIGTSGNPSNHVNKTEQLVGNIASSDIWGSGWMDLIDVTDFKKGDTLEITLGGTAENVLVKLLPVGIDPNTSVGIAGGIHRVPSSRVIWVVLDSDRTKITQISVHGKSNPYNIALGANNGPAKIVNVVLKRT